MRKKSEKKAEIQTKLQEDHMDVQGITKSGRRKILFGMAGMLIAAMLLTVLMIVQWGKLSVDRSMEVAYNELEKWVELQLQTMNVMADSILANSSVLDDYDVAVKYLDTLAGNYEEISALYVIRPGSEHEITMNNGWVPGADYAVTEQDWYQNTLQAENGFFVSEPYINVRDGRYCITFSRLLYGASEEPTVFAMDVTANSLRILTVRICLGLESNPQFVFLVHQGEWTFVLPGYESEEGQILMLKDTPYRGINQDGIVSFVKDTNEVMMAKTEPVSGITVIMVESTISVYGLSLFYGLLFSLILFLAMHQLYKVIMRVVTWQDQVSLALQNESEKAKQADRAKSTFLAQMSHEIRTPINAVLGMNELILRESGEKNVLEYAANAYNSGKALLSIINDVLDISKIEAGKMEITEAEYDLYSLVSDCYLMTLDRAKKKGLDFRYSVDEKLPVRLRGDMVHIRQIVVNFITNAIKYSNRGSVELMFKGERTADGLILKVSVKDTGIGLTEESMAKLFTSFQRFDLKRNQAVEGTGLGLSICKQLAELMGGGVSVESVYGEGSTFYCSIPQKIADDVPVGRVSLSQPQGQKLEKLAEFTAEDAHILVVDDVEMNLVVFAGLLKGHGLKIDKAVSGQQCLKLVTQQKYDIIFMDHMMPEMDGMETYARMQEMEHLNKETPVIMLTANAISGDREKYLAAGFASYLSKPVQGDKLTNMLLEFLPEDKIIWKDPEAGDAAPEGTAETADGSSAASEEGMADGMSVSDDELLNISLGMRYSGDDREIYLEILASYLDGGIRRIERIKALYEEGAWKDYVTEVHALKSTSLTIGSKRLSEAALELEQAGKAGNYELIREKNEELLSLYEQVLARGDSLLSQWKEKGETSDQKLPLKEITAEELQAYHGRLKDAAEAFDGDEILAMCEELSAYSYRGKALREDVQKIRSAAADFDYELAGQETECLFEKLLD